VSKPFTQTENITFALFEGAGYVLNPDGNSDSVKEYLELIENWKNGVRQPASGGLRFWVFSCRRDMCDGDSRVCMVWGWWTQVMFCCHLATVYALAEKAVVCI